MLDKKVKIDPGTGFSVIPEDKYQVQLVDVNAVEQANSFKGGVMETRLNYQFAILDEKKEDENFQSLRGRYLWKRVSLSLNEKSWLYRLASAVKGSSLTQEEKEKFDPEAIIGKQVVVMTTNVKANNGNIYTNILSFSHPKEEMEKIDFELKPAEVVKSSSPVNAPKEEKEEHEFIKGLEEDKKKEEVSQETIDDVFGTDKKKK